MSFSLLTLHKLILCQLGFFLHIIVDSFQRERERERGRGSAQPIVYSLLHFQCKIQYLNSSFEDIFYAKRSSYIVVVTMILSLVRKNYTGRYLLGIFPSSMKYFTTDINSFSRK